VIRADSLSYSLYGPKLSSTPALENGKRYATESSFSFSKVEMHTRPGVALQNAMQQ